MRRQSYAAVGLVLAALLAALILALAASAWKVVLPGELLGWLAVLFAALVGYRAAKLYFITRANQQVIVSDFSNSSGIAALDTTMPGLTLSARQEVLRKMEGLGKRAKKAAPDGEGYDVLLEATLPSAQLDTKLTDLAKALGESVPEDAKPAAQLLSLLVSPRGTAVSGRLQMMGDAPGRAGISLEVADIQGLRTPRSDDFWEEPRADEGGEGAGAPAGAEVPKSKPAGGGDTDPDGWWERVLKRAREKARRWASWAAGEPNPKEPLKEEDPVREARALVELGLLYEGRGAPEQARTAFEEAAKKDPDNPRARVGLTRALSANNRTPSERYRALLGPACRWLAAELARDKLLSGSLGPFAPDKKRREAEVHNFVGSYHTYGDPKQPAFLRAAERELRLAIEKADTWYLPYANLGDVISYRGHQVEEGGPGGDRRRYSLRQRIQREAIEIYDKALGLHPETPPKDERPINRSGPDLSRHRIELSKAVAQLLSREAVAMQEALGVILGVQRRVDGPGDHDARLIYVLACASAALADATGSKEWKAAGIDATSAAQQRVKALRYRDLAIEKDPTGDLRDWAEKDPDLASLPKPGHGVP